MERKTASWTSRRKKNTTNLAFWTAIWVLTLAIATFGFKFMWEENTTISLFAFIINIGAGIGMIMANIKYVRSLDEMQQKIQLEAMGIALGVGVVGGLSYSLLDITNLIMVDAEISFLVILIGLSYLAAMIIGHFRYQ